MALTPRTISMKCQPLNRGLSSTSSAAMEYAVSNPFLQPLARDPEAYMVQATPCRPCPEEPTGPCDGDTTATWQENHGLSGR
jgi:hypothetical protein